MTEVGALSDLGQVNGRFWLPLPQKNRLANDVFWSGDDGKGTAAIHASAPQTGQSPIGQFAFGDLGQH